MIFNSQVLFPVGGLVGTLIAGWMVDRFGRKLSLMAFSITCTIGWLLIILTLLTEGSLFRLLIFAGRFIGGIGVGFASLCAPVSKQTQVHYLMVIACYVSCTYIRTYIILIAW